LHNRIIGTTYEIEHATTLRKISEAGIAVIGANILVMGLTFKENCIIFDLKYLFKKHQTDLRL